MLISDAFCYALLTITITATCVGGEQATQEGERRIEKRNKREAALLIDSYPTSTYKTKPDIIYQRVSKTKYRKSRQKHGPVIPKYRPPKPMYGPPKPKPKYGPPKPKHGRPKPPSYKHRKPVKKHRRKPIRPSKYNNRRLPMSKYGPIKKPYGPPKHKRPQKAPSYAEPVPFGEPAGFGEPPKDHVKEYVQPPQQNYAEPPVDSYGVPLNAANFPTTEQFNRDNYDNVNEQYQSFQSYQHDLNVDNINSHSNNRPIYANPEAGFYDEKSKYEDFHIDSYSDVYKNAFFNPDLNKSKLKYNFSHNIQKNKPWKSRVKAGDNDHIVVGGQYAEPPGRLVRQSHPSELMYGEEYSDTENSYADAEVAASGTISPYVNYKNSNMAFSPQNLNDAFSITK